MTKLIGMLALCASMVILSLPADAATAANSQSGADRANPNSGRMMKGMPMKRMHKKHMHKM